MHETLLHPGTPVNTLLHYVPVDRRQALARGLSLPEHPTGAALLADLAGFTVMTEAVARAWGPQRGAEELLSILNQIYQALADEVDRYGGCIVGFAGDSILAWFEAGSDADLAGRPARSVHSPGIPLPNGALRVGPSGASGRFRVAPAVAPGHRPPVADRRSVTGDAPEGPLRGGVHEHEARDRPRSQTACRRREAPAGGGAGRPDLHSPGTPVHEHEARAGRPDLHSPGTPVHEHEARAGRRAVACALAMQAAMPAFQTISMPGGQTLTLALKTSVATGRVRRLLVGDPSIQRLEVLAGETMTRLADAAGLAQAGDVVLDPHACRVLARDVVLDEAQPAGQRGLGCASIRSLTAPVEPRPWHPIAEGVLEDDRLRPWLLPPVYARLHSGQGEFLTELRHTLSLFLQFADLPYDEDVGAGPKLDSFICWVQRVLARYEGWLLQVTLGDKGSYLYVTFGAPVAHGDDAARVLGAALELSSPPAELSDMGPTKIGVSGGLSRAGAVGGSTRTYGVMGDATNLAARLMQAAAPGQILVSASLAPSVSRRYVLDPIPPIQVKGKAAPVPVMLLRGEQPPQTMRLPEPQYGLPLVGRADEVAVLEGAIAQARRGQGQTVALTAEAGMGKSRLVAETLQRARASGFVCLAGAAEAPHSQAAYFAWQPIWQSFFGLHPDASQPVQAAALEQALAALDSDLLPRLPLLGAAVGLPLPDNDLTRGLEARLRKEALEGLLVDCLKARPTRAPDSALCIALEDVHWLDMLSIDLLGAISRAIPGLPVLLLWTCRPAEAGSALQLQLADLPARVALHLGELPPDAMARLIEHRVGLAAGGAGRLAGPSWSDTPLHSVPGADAGATRTHPATPLARSAGRGRAPLGERPEAPEGTTRRAPLGRGMPGISGREAPGRPAAAFVEAITARAEGNPFYAEELLNYLDDRGIAPDDLAALEQLELPGSLASLILSRIDQLSAEQQTVLKVASVIGRSFRFDWLWGVHPALGAPEQVRLDLDMLARLDITPLDTPSPELAYLFKHATIQEVAYASMPYASQAQLHEQLAVWLEERAASLDLLAYHYGRSLNLGKQRQYFRQAGDAAAGRYANAAAIQYYERLLALLEPAGQGPALIALARLLTFTSDWEAAEAHYHTALGLAGDLADVRLQAQAELGLGMMKRTLGLYREAEAWLDSAERGFSAVSDRAGLIDALAELAFVCLFQARADRAQVLMERGMALADQEGDRRLTARALHMLGNIVSFKSDLGSARPYWLKSLALRRELGDKPGIAALATNLALEAFEAGRYDEAQALLTECLALDRELGARKEYAQARLLLPLILTMQGETRTALAMQAENLALARDLQAMQQIADGLVLLAWQTQLAEPAPEASRYAVRLVTVASKLQAAIGSKMVHFIQQRADGVEAEANRRLDRAEVEAARVEGQGMSWEAAVAHALDALPEETVSPVSQELVHRHGQA